MSLYGQASVFITEGFPGQELHLSLAILRAFTALAAMDGVDVTEHDATRKHALASALLALAECNQFLCQVPDRTPDPLVIGGSPEQVCVYALLSTPKLGCHVQPGTGEVLLQSRQGLRIRELVAAAGLLAGAAALRMWTHTVAVAPLPRNIVMQLAAHVARALGALGIVHRSNLVRFLTAQKLSRFRGSTRRVSTRRRFLRTPFPRPPACWGPHKACPKQCEAASPRARTLTSTPSSAHRASALTRRLPSGRGANGRASGRSMSWVQQFPQRAAEARATSRSGAARARCRAAPSWSRRRGCGAHAAGAGWRGTAAPSTRRRT